MLPFAISFCPSGPASQDANLKDASYSDSKEFLAIQIPLFNEVVAAAPTILVPFTVLSSPV